MKILTTKLIECVFALTKYTNQHLIDLEVFVSHFILGKLESCNNNVPQAWHVKWTVLIAI